MSKTKLKVIEISNGALKEREDLIGLLTTQGFKSYSTAKREILELSYPRVQLHSDNYYTVGNGGSCHENYHTLKEYLAASKPVKPTEPTRKSMVDTRYCIKLAGYHDIILNEEEIINLYSDIKGALGNLV